MWSLSGRPTSGTGIRNSKSARGQNPAEDTCLSGVYRLEIVYILCDFPRVSHGSLPSCTLLGRIKRTHNNRSTLGSQGRPHRSKSRPVSACVAGLGPRWGNGPVPARSGAIWAPQGPVWQKEKKPPPLPVGGKFGGVILKQVKGPGSPTGVPCRVTSPGRAGRSGIFPRRQFPHFPGSVWLPWGYDRGQKHKISRWQAILRVSPPGSTKG